MGERLGHTFEPIFNENSKILILGTFPSVKSREEGFYYYHPQNRFWKVIAHLTRSEVPISIEAKKELLLEKGIALWDVIGSCEIEGSSDSSIKNVVPADLKIILDHANIEQIYANGGKAYELYMRYAHVVTGRDIIKLPSTSPANASFSLERLQKEWEVIEHGQRM